MKKVIHVNQHITKKNRKENLKCDPLTCKSRIGNEKSSEIAILGPAKVVYRPDKPLKCGAVCWIETDSEVKTGLEAKHYANHAPCVQINFALVPIGYQMDIYVDGKHYLTECRDFGGNAKPSALKRRVCELAQEIAKTLREEN